MTDNYKIICGDMLQELDKMPECSIDAIVTDPPYELAFMGKSWDASGISFQPTTWEKCLRVLKPGGYLLAFGGSRTYHRIACAIEDAGFEIRDCIMYLFGSGFPKSMNIGLAVDKKNGVESEIVGYVDASMPDFQDAGKKNSINKIGINDGESADRKDYPIYKAQNEWAGWGSCLKPAYEPVVIARKPFEGSLIDNVLKNGVGGLNIDECRVGIGGGTKKDTTNCRDSNGIYGDGLCGGIKMFPEGLGRFPANVILTYDESDYDEVCGDMPIGGQNGTVGKVYSDTSKIYGDYVNKLPFESYGDSGSASRYFYCAKASRRDRDEGLDDFEDKIGGSMNATIDQNLLTGSGNIRNNLRKNIHPTVKPTSLMQYLIRLVSPKGATILDPFMGSGSTGKAVAYENFDRNADYKFIGIELSEEYVEIAKARIEYASKYPVALDTSNLVKKTDTKLKSKKLF